MVTFGIDAGGTSSLALSPTMFNPYAPNNIMFISTGNLFLVPLAFYDPWNNTLLPALAIHGSIIHLMPHKMIL